MTQAPQQIIDWIKLYSGPSNPAIPNDFLITENQVNPSYLISKQDILVSGTNIKTINNSSILGSGNITLDSWNKTGNAGTNPSTDFLGTTDNVDLVFKTNNIQKVRIPSTGGLSIYVPNGSNTAMIIGTDNSGNTSFYNYYSSGKITFLVANAKTAIEIGPKPGWGDYSITKLTGQVLLTGTTLSTGETLLTVSGTSSFTGNVAIGTTTDGGRLYIQAQGALSTDNVFRIRNSANNADLFNVLGDGNVLVGTSTNSGFKFEVLGESKFRSLTLNGLNNGGGSAGSVILENGSSDLLITNSIAGGAKFRMLPFAGDIYFDNINNNGNTIFRIGTSALEVMRFIHSGVVRIAPNAGNVLIGTTTDAGFKLDVNGTSRVQKINISAIPTSSAGLVAGDVWNDAGTLKIV